MAQMESTKRKMQKKNDYQRHKLFRKIKRRRKAQAEAEQQIAEKQLKKKLKLPKFGDGKEKVNLDNAHFDKEGNLVDNTTGVKYTPTSNDVVITPNTKYFYDPHASAGNYFDGNWSKDFINMMPGIGDAIDVAQVIDDTSKGKYVSAGAGALMLALPNFVEKPFKLIGKKALPFMFNKINTKGIGRYTMGEPVLPSKTIRIQNDSQPFVFDYNNPFSQHIKRDDKRIGEYITSGGESDVYNTVDGKSVIKFKDGIYQPSQNFDELQSAVQAEDKLNNLPFFFKQKYLGWSDKHDVIKAKKKVYPEDTFYTVLSQPKVTPFSKVADPWFTLTENDGRQGALRFFDENKIYDYLKSYGVERTSEPGVYKYNGITFGDVAPRNAGIDKNGKLGFLDLLIHDYNSGKDIRIKKSKRGTFTKAAKQHGMSVQGFANRVLRNPSKYSAAMRKKANFAHNASSWKH